MSMSQWIDAYEQGGEKLREAVAGLSQDEMNAFPVPGTWSIQQICVHLFHSDLFAVGRMCQIIAEDVPLLMVWDENSFVAKLRYETLAIEQVLAGIESMRKTMSATLRQLKPDDFDRVGIHSKLGKVSLRETLEKYTRHLEHHLNYLNQKRQMLKI